LPLALSCQQCSQHGQFPTAKRSFDGFLKL
jgi:hypothetical protein